MFCGFSSSEHPVYNLTDTRNYDATNGKTEGKTRQHINAKSLRFQSACFTFPNDNILDQTIYYIQNNQQRFFTFKNLRLEKLDHGIKS